MHQGLALACRLWWLGIWESLQLHRCVVLLDLDSSKALGRKLLHCLKVNGGIFLGSILWWRWVLQPSSHWLLLTFFQPVAGPWATLKLEAGLLLGYQLLWLAPVYAVTFAVSCALYNDMAAEAVQVRSRHAAAVRAPHSHLTHQTDAWGSTVSVNGHSTAVQGTAAAPQPAAGSGVKSGAAPDAALGAVAQEVYRVVLFAVLYAEVWLAGCLPHIGGTINFICSCWLYAYYAYDYQWALRGVSLPDRLAFFESSAPFFAGFGSIMALITSLLPFYLGAAVMAILFPLFVLVACDSDPARVIRSAAVLPQAAATKADGGTPGTTQGSTNGQQAVHSRGSGGPPGLQAQQQQQQQQAGYQEGSGIGGDQRGIQKVSGLIRVPLFQAALWPTERLLSLILGRGSSKAGSSSSSSSKAGGSSSSSSAKGTKDS